MCSDGLRKVGIYETMIKRLNPNSIVIYPSEELQSIVTKGICNSKNMKRFLPITHEEHPHYCFNKVCDWFEKQDCDTIVAGCTDIRNVFFRESNHALNYIDSLEALANAIILRSKNNEIPV